MNNFISIPPTYKEVVEHESWRKAMAKGLHVFETSHTSDLVFKPIDVSMIGSKWVYTIKVKSDTSIDQHKACLWLKVINKNMELIMNICFLQ